MGRSTTVMGALVLVVAACGGSASPTAAPATVTPTAATPAPATPAPTTTAPPMTPVAISASVAFDGKTCTYAGPAVVPMGASVTLTLTSTYAEASMVVIMPVVDGTTWDQIVADTAKIPASQVPAWGQIPASGDAEIKYDPKSVTTVTTRNAYFVGCATAQTDTDKMFPAVLLKVLPS